MSKYRRYGTLAFRLAQCGKISRSTERDQGTIKLRINQELNGRYNWAGYIIGKKRYDTNFIVAKAGYDNPYKDRIKTCKRHMYRIFTSIKQVSILCLHGI